MSSVEAHTHELKQHALALGFARVGVAEATALEDDAERLRAWLKAGFHGEMRYMQETAEVRADPSHPRMLPGTRSVIALATSFAGCDGSEPHAGVEAKSGPDRDAGTRPRLARYARGRDYHNVIGKRLNKLARLLRARQHRVRYSVDTMPVLERAWAQRAGLGFIGKNGCLIVPGLGSHVFLSVMLTDAELTPDEPLAEGCGNCTRCLDACPTQAFSAPRVLDARRCISYLTIEHRGAIEPALRESLGSWLFGCDVCQDVCPFNHGQAARVPVAPEFASKACWGGLEPGRLVQLDEEGYQTLLEGSPLKRAGRAGLARNAALVLGNSGNKRHLPLLEAAATQHRHAPVRDAARWAATRLRGLG